MKIIVSISVILLSIADLTANVIKQTTDSLNIYYPQYKPIDLVCETIPSQNDESIVMLCEAAFTGECLKYFCHKNIAGNHTSEGTSFKGYA